MGFVRLNNKNMESVLTHAYNHLSFTLKYLTNVGATGSEMDKLLLEMLKISTNKN